MMTRLPYVEELELGVDGLPSSKHSQQVLTGSVPLLAAARHSPLPRGVCRRPVAPCGGQ